MVYEFFLLKSMSCLESLVRVAGAWTAGQQGSEAGVFLPRSLPLATTCLPERPSSRDRCPYEGPADRYTSARLLLDRGVYFWFRKLLLCVFYYVVCCCLFCNRHHSSCGAFSEPPIDIR